MCWVRNKVGGIGSMMLEMGDILISTAYINHIMAVLKLLSYRLHIVNGGFFGHTMAEIFGTLNLCDNISAGLRRNLA